MNTEKMVLVAPDTYQFSEYKTPNWLTGQSYNASDTGTTLTKASETGNFYLQGKVREWMLSTFKKVSE